MRIAHVVTSLDPEHGGPSVSVRALAVHQAATAGENVCLLTTAPTARQSRVGDLEIHELATEWPARLGRSRALSRLLHDLPLEVVHAHGLWQRPLHYAQAGARRHGALLVISPRGMLSRWARHHHPVRKFLARHCVHPRAFEEATGWHATSPEEAREIRALGFPQPICIAPNGVAVPLAADLAGAREWWHRQYPETAQRPVALFYGRFHQKKRVRELIELWAATFTGEWLLLVAGLAEDYDVAALSALAALRGAAGKVCVVDGRTAPAPYAVANMFLLPSHNENFGLAIAEAMAAGVPVVVTDSTPWSRLRDDGTGWCVPWSEYPTALRNALALGADRLATLGRQAAATIARDFTWPANAARLLEFYRNLRK